MMNRIERAFQNKKPFIGYLTGGDGGLEYSINCASALITGGVDMLEIGLPFSDPVADGVVIQKAHERALKAGTTSTTVLQMAKSIRQSSDIPLVLFSYYNPLLQKGPLFLQQLKLAGFDAVLAVDLAIPLNPEQKEPFFQALTEAHLLPILLATPSTAQDRLMQIGHLAKGFIYYVSQKGTTGIRNKLADDFSVQMARMRTNFQIPIVAGFGIADCASASAALRYADGFVVGSAFVSKMAEMIAPEELTKVAQSIDPRQGHIK